MRFFALTLACLLVWGPAGGADARKKGTDSDIVLLKRVTPPFPLDAYAACTPGFVVAEFTIDERGDVVDIDLLESEPPGVFDAATTAALSEWQFSPRIVNGEAARERVSQRIDFTISSECTVGAELPDELAALQPFDEAETRQSCMRRGAREFGFAELNFRVDADGRPGHVTVVRSSGEDYVRRAREELNKRDFDPSYEALTFSHTFAFCVSGG